MNMYGHSFQVDNRQILTAAAVSRDQIARFFDNLQVSEHRGRLPMMEGNLKGMTCMVRRFHHGGLLGKLLGYRYWGARPRSFRELNVLTECGEHQLPVVQPVFAWVKPRLAGYEQGLVTVKEPRARDLLASDPLNSEQLTDLVEILEQFFANGLHHPDLNIKNILFDEKDNRFVLLDFDRARLTGIPTPMPKRMAIYRRLIRSFDKRGRWDVWSAADRSAFPVHVQRAFRQYERIRPFRALLWKRR